MSQFTTPAKLEMLDHYKWRLIEPFTFYIDDDLGWRAAVGKYEKAVGVRRGFCLMYYIDVPAGYITDLASVPRALWSVFPPHGRYAKAAIVHDYLYSNAIGTKAWADLVFKDAMVVLEVPRWRRTVMYWAVRFFGKGKYK